MNTNGWRTRRTAQVLVHGTCFSLLLTSTAPLYAAPPPALPGLPRPAANWLHSGSATGSVNGTTMTVDQLSQRAILDWEQFNIERGYTVQFNQPGASAVALNRIFDQAPSQIFGNLKANGNVYLINPNGILFGTGAQINVHGLVAATATLDSNDRLYQNSSLQQAIDQGGAALSGLGANPAAKIEIAGGASIRTDNGGQVLVFAPEIVNAGDIATPDGQTVLAASRDKVYIAASDKDQDLRGLLVEVDTGGDVTNVGSIVAERGNITLLGLAVNQNGHLRATTSVDVNGSIRLLARDRASLVAREIAAPDGRYRDSLMVDSADEVASAVNLPIATRSGTVSIGAGAVTEVVADNNGKTAVDAQTQNKSRIDIVGNTIDIGAGSRTEAKSGRINITATATPDDPYNAELARNNSRIYLGAGALLDVSGEHVLLPMERRLVEVELRGDELKDAPLQRNGVLRGKTVKVDIEKGSPLISDLGPTLAKIQKGVKERLTEGGSINLRSQGDVLFGGEAVLDLRGGSVTYASGAVATTKLLSGGRIFDIGDADPNRRYDAVLGEYIDVHPKWGETVYGGNSLFSRGTLRDRFVEGSAGGALAIDAPLLYGLDLAELRAGALAGVNQRSAAARPQGGSIAINLGQRAVQGGAQNAIIGAGAASVHLDRDASLIQGGTARDVYIAADRLNASGLGSFSLNVNGAVQLQEQSRIALQPFAKFSLGGTALRIDGAIASAGGTIDLVTRAPAGSNTFGNFAMTFGAGSVLDTSGVWSNDLAALNPLAPTAALVLNGGTIRAVAKGDLIVDAGAQLRADAGARIDSAGTFSGGNGGAISLASQGSSSATTGSRLQIDGALSALGFERGGSLNLQANAFQIGGSSADSGVFWLTPEFFRGGFSAYTLTANLHGIEVVADTRVELRQHNLQVSDLRAAARQLSGADVRGFSNLVELPAHQRRAVDLTLALDQRVNAVPVAGYLRVGSNAQILGEAGARIALASDNSLYVDGTISAPGGAISLDVLAPKGSADRGYSASQALWLGPNAKLMAQSAFVAQPNAQGLQLGKVYDAGTISLNAYRGAVVVEPGALLDVSGASYTQDYLRGDSRLGYRRQRIDASAGALAFRAAETLAVYGDLRGFGSGDGYGGSLSFSLDSNDRNDAAALTSLFPYTALELQVYASLPAWNTALQFGQALPAALGRRAWVAADAVQAGGFSTLTLAAANQQSRFESSQFGAAGRIVFAGDLALTLADSLVLDAANIDVGGHTVRLAAGALALGSSDNTALAQTVVAASAGSGRLDLVGRFIELLGNIGIAGAQRVALDSAGDVRLRAHIDALDDRKLAAATLTTPADLSIRAAQIYPTTLTDYTIKLSGANSVFSSTGSGAARTPILSAGGTLRVLAPVIEHGGIMAAPLGQLLLGSAAATRSVHLSAGSVLDVSADHLIPFGRLRGGDISWIYPIDPLRPLLIGQTPEKRIELAAQSIAMDSGASIDLSGGGDIYAFEQIPGPGGSKDFLDAANADGAFAVVPWLNSPVSPYDTVEMAGATIRPGAVVYLDAAAGLAAGYYAVLPAHYALLPGAYLITPTHTTVAAGASGQRSDGTPIVSGRFGRAFSAGHDSQYQAFLIETGSAARARSEYKEAVGDKYFADKNVDLAADAGRLVLEARTALSLAATIDAAAQAGRRAQLDIVADRIEVVSQVDAGSTAVQLDVAALNALDIDSLLLGGRRSRAGSATDIDVRSDSVTVRSGAALSAPDLILAARGQVAVEAGASVRAETGSTETTQLFRVAGDGALLRVSSAAQADVQRTGSINGSTGVLNIAAGATIGSGGSALLDATRDLSLGGVIALEQGSLNLTANRISLGDGIGAVGGVVLDNAALAALNARELRLSSRSSIDFYGDVAFANQRAELNSGALRGMAPGAVRIEAADTLQLGNTIGASASPAAAGGGELQLVARTVEVGGANDSGSQMQLGGFEHVQIGAAGTTAAVTGNGAFTLKVDGALTLLADRIGGSAGAATAIDAGGAVSLLAANAATTPATAAGAGASLAITGTRIEQGARIELPGGKLALTASAGDVVLRDGSVTDVSGRSQVFPGGASVHTDGGSIVLTSSNADVVAQAGAQVNIGGGSSGGDAGTLAVLARSGRTLWQAGIAAVSVNGAQGGSLELDVGSLADLGAWLQRSAAAGIDRALAIRARSGDLVIDQTVRARDVRISADSGALSVAANIDARGVDGGKVALNAGGDLLLAAGSSIDARATGAAGRGGRVELGSSGGTLQLGAGSAIAVNGNGGRAGQVNLNAPRRAGNTDVALLDDGVSIAGAERIELAGYNIFDSAVIDTGLLATVRADAAAFMANEAAIRARLGNLAAQEAFHLLPGVEIRSAGNLSVNTALELADWRFGANNEAGALTLRAGGDLIVAQSLRDGFVADSSGYSNSGLFLPADWLLEGASWDYRLVAGADLGAADSTATVAGRGDLRVINNADILTGAGDIGLFAGRHIDVQGSDSAIASLGSTRYFDYTSNPLAAFGFADAERLAATGTLHPYLQGVLMGQYAQYPEHGGDITLAAGGDVKFAAGDHFFSDWIARIGGSVDTGALGLPFDSMATTAWGVIVDYFTRGIDASGGGQQGIAALGGGNLAVRAGGDIRNLNAALPVTGRQTGAIGADGVPVVNAVEILGGGNLDVWAGGNILSPRLLVDKGRAALVAGGAIDAGAGGLGAILALADTQLSLKARGDIVVDAVFNSTVMPQSAHQTYAGSLVENYFFTYSDNAELNLSSSAGDVRLRNASAAVTTAFQSRFPDRGQSGRGLFGGAIERGVLALYPATLRVAAGGDIEISNSMKLFPAANGQLELLAGASIAAPAGAVGNLQMSDTNPALLPGIAAPVWALELPLLAGGLDTLALIANARVLRGAPIHAADTQPAVIAALAGDIGSSIAELGFDLPKQTRLYAGRDIVNVGVQLQHSRDNEISEIGAGRDILFPLLFDSSGAVRNSSARIVVAGPGRLDVIAGRDINLGASQGIQSIGNLNNPVLPDSGADLTLLAGINGASALSDPVLYAAFAERYLGASGGPAGSFVDWFGRGGFGGDAVQLVGVFTGVRYANNSEALAAFAALPVLTQQAISLEAWRSGRELATDYSADLIDFVSFDRFAGNLAAALLAATGVPYADNGSAAAALALLPAAQQHQIARAALDTATAGARRELLLEVVFAEVRQGGIENARGLVTDASREGFARSNAAIAQLFPGSDWRGAIDMVFSTVRTVDDGDINLLTPGGGIDVGLAGNFAGNPKGAAELGIVAQRYGAINAIADGNISINQSRIFSLDSGPIALWSSNGDIDAGRGAKTALSIPPPITVIDSNGMLKTEFPPAISGSGIQAARNNRKDALERGPLAAGIGADTLTARARWFRSLQDSNAYLFAPRGVIDAGDAGIAVSGNLLLAAQQVIGADNIDVGGVSIGVPTTTSVAAGTLSLGDVASTATESATNAMNEALKEAAAALSESGVAFVTVDIIGIER